MCSPSTSAPPLAIRPLDPATYRRHPLHGEGRTWPETNCYTDLLIEVVHGFGHEPLAMLPFTLAIDFEGDQWTFFKPPHAELEALYGMDVQELALWKPLAEHVVEQVQAGHPVLVELDSWYLPDTSGTAYRLLHNKTTVGVNAIDVKNRRMGYFHNAGYFSVEGDDFAQLFHLDGLPHDRVLPPYVEFVKWTRGFRALQGRELVEASLPLLARHLKRAPPENPFPKFRDRFARDLEWLMQANIGRFHAYSFANLRQYGACFELAESYLRWLGDNGVDGVVEPAAALKQLSETAKALQFQLARSMARKKPLDLAPIDAMGQLWERAMEPLKARIS